MVVLGVEAAQAWVRELGGALEGVVAEPLAQAVHRGLQGLLAQPLGLAAKQIQLHGALPGQQVVRAHAQGADGLFPAVMLDKEAVGRLKQLLRQAGRAFQLALARQPEELLVAHAQL